MKTRAALFHAPGEPFEIAEIELDEPRVDEVVIRMAAVGICGTDLHQVKGEFRRPTPMVLGHEGSGVVEWAGPAVTTVQPGDEVVLSWAPGCGDCAGCRRGRPATCRPLNVAIAGGTLSDGRTGMSYRGETVYRGTGTGCLAERVVLTERAALPVHGVPLAEAALLGCAALTGVGAVLHAAKVAPGSTVLVIGAGGVGQFIVQGARIAGATAIVVSDSFEARRERARSLGATHVAAPEELEKVVAAAAPDLVDVAFDAVGLPTTVATALRHLRDGGTAVVVGLPPAGVNFEIEPFELIRREKRLTGTLYGSVDPAEALPELLEYVADGRLELAALAGERFALDEIDAAVAASLAGSSGRVLVTFPVSALEGLLVADLSRVLAGPLVGMTLGDLGADVIKVESPDGDDTRTWKPPVDPAGGATYFHAANRNKRSLVLDLKATGDLELARRLCERVDVVIANFRPGTLERYGLGYEQIAALNPGVVYCEISGFGEAGGADLPGYDPLVQAVGGLMSITGPPGRPSKVGVALVDVIAGLYATTAVLAALAERRRSGRGQRVTVNLLHAALAALVNQAAAWLLAGVTPAAQGNVHPSIEPFATYRARDGDLMICAGNDRQFRALVSELGLPDMAGDERFATNGARVANRDELRPLLEGALAADDPAGWSARLLAAGVPAGPINDVPAAFAYAASLGLDAVREVDGVPTVAYPATLSRTPAAERRSPPALGQHDDELRRWLSGPG